ncbi:MAG: PucR family transcriptional regulator [Leucobacter sp.]
MKAISFANLSGIDFGDAAMDGGLAMAAHASPTHSSIELGTLMHQFHLHLVFITGAAAESASLPVQWVHNSDMADPTPFLTPRTVLLTTGAQFADDAAQADMDAYVTRLQNAGVTALGFGVGIVWQRIPPALIAAAERLHLPLFRVPYDTPFIAIVRTAARLLDEQSHSRDIWALDAQRAVAGAALQRDGLGSVIREAAGQLGGWIGIADRTGGFAEFAPRAAGEGIDTDWIRRECRELIGRGTRGNRVRTLDGQAIQLQTLGRSGQLLGVLVTRDTPDPAERALLGLVAALVTAGLERRAGLSGAETALRSAVVRLLLIGETESAEQVAAGVLPRLPRGRIAAIRIAAISALDPAVALDLRSLAAGRAGLLTAPLDEGAVLIGESAALTAARRLLTEHRIAAGVSERGELDELGTLLDQAGTALEHALRTGAREPLAYRPAMHAGVLSLLGADPEAHRRAETLLAPVRQHDRRHRDRIEESLAVWLAHHGQTSPAAAELEVHRHTLRSRVQTAASLLQRDLDDPGTRAELWTALRLTRPADAP